LLAGCATPPLEPAIPEFQVLRKFDGVAVFSLKPNEDLKVACSAAAQTKKGSIQPAQDTACLVNDIAMNDLAQALRDTGAFGVVDIGGMEQDFGIAIGTSLSPRRPTSIRVTSLLLWRGQQIDELNYELPYAALMRKRGGNDPSQLARSITAHIVHDVITEGAFTPERVHQALGSSDYENAMIAPAELSSFTKYSLHKFVDPMLGIAVRYRHFNPQSGHIDLFVYPIRATQWQDAQAILADESVSVRQDLMRMKDQGVHQLVRLNDDEFLNWPGPFGNVDLLYFDGEIANADFQPFDTSTYIYLRQDKLVKVRATRPRNAPSATDSGQSMQESVEEFVMQLLPSLQVPAESVYMRQIRQRWSTSQSDEP
jgi:hypothetical protein